MKQNTLILLLSALVCSSCEFNKSMSSNLVTSLKTSGNGLSCDYVSLSSAGEDISRNSFIYGESFELNFNTIEGFKKEDKAVFPGLELLILGQEKDTIMYNPDLYAKNTEGYEISPLILQAYITVASPMHSNEKYDLFINIWDKKGAGTFKAQMEFEVLANAHIKIDSEAISYDEIYLYSQKRDLGLISNEALFDENIYMLFEGLEGFTQEDGKVFLGIRMKGKTAEGEIIIDEKDLAGETPMDYKEVHQRLSANIVLTGSNIKNPFSWEIEIWDKKSEKRLKANVDLLIK